MAKLKFQPGLDQSMLALSILFIISLVYSVYLLSVSLFLFGFISLLKYEDGKFLIKLRSDFLDKISLLLKNPAWWIISASLFIVLFGGLYSDDTAYWLVRLRIKAPFLLLPIAFFLIPKIETTTYLKIHFVFIVVMILTTVPLLWHLADNYVVVVDALRHGRPVATPISHIRYSLMLALAAASSFLLYKDERFKTGFKRQWMFVPMSYLIILLHFLAVRSGLAALYVMAIIYGVSRLVQTGHILSSLLILASILMIPVVAYHSIPTFKERVRYMVEDAAKYNQQNWNDYSDAERILSIRAGLHIAGEHLWFGTGTADLKDEMKAYFYTNFDKDTYIMPHNQFVSVVAAHGLIGLFCFLLALFLPLTFHEAFHNHFFLALQIIILVSLMVENTLETSVGVAFYLFFTLLGLNHQKTL